MPSPFNVRFIGRANYWHLILIGKIVYRLVGNACRISFFVGQGRSGVPLYVQRIVTILSLADAISRWRKNTDPRPSPDRRLRPNLNGYPPVTCFRVRLLPSADPLDLRHAPTCSLPCGTVHSRVDDKLISSLRNGYPSVPCRRRPPLRQHGHRCHRTCRRRVAPCHDQRTKYVVPSDSDNPVADSIRRLPSHHKHSGPRMSARD